MIPTKGARSSRCSSAWPAVLRKACPQTSEGLVHDPQQRRLARAVAADQANPVQRPSCLRVSQVQVQQFELLVALDDDSGDSHGRYSSVARYRDCQRTPRPSHRHRMPRCRQSFPAGSSLAGMFVAYRVLPDKGTSRSADGVGRWCRPMEARGPEQWTPEYVSNESSASFAGLVAEALRPSSAHVSAARAIAAHKVRQVVLIVWSSAVIQLSRLAVDCTASGSGFEAGTG